MKRIYLDNAALTPTRKEVLKEINAYSSRDFGNPSSIHAEGVKAKKAFDEARKTAATFLGAHADEIIFTGSGTEANNMAILGVVEKALHNGKKYSELHAVTSTIEHASVLETFKELERRGMSVAYAGVDEKGIVRLEEIKKVLNEKTLLVSIMYVNNEIGTIQPIKEIAKLLRHATTKPIFHTDASQAALYLEVNVEKLGVDLLTLDAHKVYGPKGIGLLYIKRGIELAPLNFGGGQEKGLRSATENLPAAKGFAKALELAAKEREKETTRISSLRDYCVASLLALGKNIEVNGDLESRIANNIHVSIPNIDTEFLVLQLDAAGIAVSTKSSCLRDSDESYVLRALGKKDPKNGLRITLGKDTKKRHMDRLIKKFSL